MHVEGKVDGAVCLAAYRAKPVVPVLRDRCFECVYVYIVIVCWAVCLNWNKDYYCWPLTHSFFLLGVFTSVPILVKIDQEMRPWECSQTDRQTDRQIHWQTQTDFIICPMLYAIAMGQIKSLKREYLKLNTLRKCTDIGRPWYSRVYVEFCGKNTRLRATAVGICGAKE